MVNYPVTAHARVCASVYLCVCVCVCVCVFYLLSCFIVILAGFLHDGFRRGLPTLLPAAAVVVVSILLLAGHHLHLSPHILVIYTVVSLNDNRHRSLTL